MSVEQIAHWVDSVWYHLGLGNPVTSFGDLWREERRIELVNIEPTGAKPFQPFSFDCVQPMRAARIEKRGAGR